VAAGHGRRDLALSVAYQHGLVTEVVVLDQDQNSLDQVVADYGQGPAKVTPLPLSVRSLLAGKHDLGEFDLIYSVGLYDYLDTATAQRLTSRLFDALSPGGRLLYANFAPDIHSVGYMDAAMDWRLIDGYWRRVRSNVSSADLLLLFLLPAAAYFIEIRL